MKIFSRGNEPAKPADAGKPASTPAATQLVIPGQPKPAPAPAPAATSAAPASAGPANEAAAPPNPDLTAIIEANVKEMSEKIARLASTIEGDHTERAEFESKLDKMEERMRKLSSLTEMISAQYNPFVGAAPTEREAPPAPEIGLAMPPLAAPPTQAPIAAAPPLPQLVAEPPMGAASAAPQLVLEDPFASVAPALEPPLAAPPSASSPDMGLAAFANPPPSAQVPTAPVEEPTPGGVRLYDITPTFASSLLVLNWADTLLKHAPDRESVARLLDYYCNVGWLGEPARDRILAYVDGIRSEGRGEGEGDQDWRAGVEVHERSLLFIEKLRALGARGE